jgi:hypothetical protein
MEVTMSGENATPPGSGILESDKKESFGSLFFEGLPTMTGIVTIIAQPFAQDSMKKMFGLPDWLPAVIALAAAGLLALYRIRIVRKSGTVECAICWPLLVFIIFSAYASGNNVVYYAKEGITKAGVQSVDTGKVAEERLTKEREEVDILRQQLKNANEMIRNMASALNISRSEPMKEGRPSTSSLFRLSAMLSVNHAYAQNSKEEGGTTERPMQPDPQQLQRLQEALKQYEETQQKLDKRIEDVQKQQKSTIQQQSPPLIKSW